MARSKRTLDGMMALLDPHHRVTELELEVAKLRALLSRAMQKHAERELLFELDVMRFNRGYEPAPGIDNA